MYRFNVTMATSSIGTTLPSVSMFVSVCCPTFPSIISPLIWRIIRTAEHAVLVSRKTAHEKNKVLLNSLGLLHPHILGNCLNHQFADSDHLNNLNTNRYCQSVQLLFADQSLFFKATRLSITEFMMLHSKLKTQLNSARSTAEINPHVHTKLTSYEQLLLWLLYIDVGASVILGLMFHGITDHSVDNYASHVTRCILNALDGSIAWPDAEEREQLYGYFSLYEKAVAVLDGTHCEIRVPTSSRTTHRWPKAKENREIISKQLYTSIIGVD